MRGDDRRGDRFFAARQENLDLQGAHADPLLLVREDLGRYGHQPLFVDDRAGNVEAAHVTLTQGAWIGLDGKAPERLAELLPQVKQREGEMVPESGAAQGTHEVGRAMAKSGRATA